MVVTGAKICSRCGGELAFEPEPNATEREPHVRVQMELDQVTAPAGQNIVRYLLVTFRTPPQVPASPMAQIKTQRPPLNFAAVLDESGSMRGEKLEQAKQALRQALARLSEGDIFSLASFSTQMHKVFAPCEMNEQTRRTVLSALAEMHAEDMGNLRGGPELGIEQAATAKRDEPLAAPQRWAGEPR